MAGFAMCAQCAAEYHDPANRRFHAQPVCCPACGPRLRLVDAHGAGLASAEPADGPLAGAVQVLRRGHVLAVKGLGGYHLAVDATSQAAAARLRARKHREDKPFAVMVPDVAAARQLCALDDPAEELLTSSRRPIVLLPRRVPGDGGGQPDGDARAAGAVADAVAPGNRQLGLMLPYAPLHHLLLREFARPMVLTSGNVSDEPIAYQDADALDRLGGIADAFLAHDRPIHIRTDDSVVRPFRGRAALLRRSRGYVPEPLRLRGHFRRPVLACGAELKNTFCLGSENRAFISHHIGDLENYETLRSFTEGITHFGRLFDITPRLVAHDLHPEYLSTKYALDLADAELVGVQHHHAHIASCLVDNDEDGQPWRMAAVYLAAAFPDGLPDGLAVAARNQAAWPDVLAMARRGVNAPVTSSCGRLFDAVASLLGVRDSINYEGQAAVELEQLAVTTPQGAYQAGISPGPPLTVAGPDLVRAAAEDLMAGVPSGVVSARFHHGVAAMIGQACLRLRDSSGLGTVALSGGVFQNLLLLGATVDVLESTGFRVLTHSRVPPNDGGISLGQAVVAGARDRAGLLG
jgi:hydrogenase maturation protein HypF